MTECCVDFELMKNEKLYKEVYKVYTIISAEYMHMLCSRQLNQIIK